MGKKFKEWEMRIDNEGEEELGRRVVPKPRNHEIKRARKLKTKNCHRREKAGKKQ